MDGLFGKYNIELQIERDGEDHLEYGIVNDGLICFPVDADVQEQDTIIRKLPNGKTQEFIATKVSVLQSPFGSSLLDHTEVQIVGKKEIPLSNKAQNYISAQNVQFIQGDSNNATMNVGMNGHDAALLIDFIVKVLNQFEAPLETKNAALVDGVKLTIEDSDSVTLPTRAANILQHAIETLSDEGIKLGLGLLLKMLISS